MCCRLTFSAISPDHVATIDSLGVLPVTILLHQLSNDVVWVLLEAAQLSTEFNSMSVLGEMRAHDGFCALLTQMKSVHLRGQSVQQHRNMNSITTGTDNRCRGRWIILFQHRYSLQDLYAAGQLVDTAFSRCLDCLRADIIKET